MKRVRKLPVARNEVGTGMGSTALESLAPGGSGGGDPPLWVVLTLTGSAGGRWGLTLRNQQKARLPRGGPWGRSPGPAEGQQLPQLVVGSRERQEPPWEFRLQTGPSRPWPPAVRAPERAEVLKVHRRILLTSFVNTFEMYYTFPRGKMTKLT